MGIWHTFRCARMTDLQGRIPAGSLERVMTLQQRRLRKLLAVARSRSPYYRRKFAGVPDGELRLDQYPPTTKEEIRDHFDELVTDRRLKRADLERFVADDANLGQWYLGKYAISHTSGSQGAPLLIVQDRHCIRVVLATMASRSRPGGPPGIVEGLRKLRKPSRVAAIVFRRGFYPSGATIEFMQEAMGPLVDVRHFSSMQPDLIDRLNDFQPNVILGYASVLEALAIQHDRLRLASLEHMTNSSEQLSRRARERIEAAFGVPIFDHYGTGECLQLADTCRHSKRLHLNADWAVLEVVDDDYRPVPAGEVGSKILVTNLANTTQPFIRYEVADRVALDAEPNVGPNCLPRIKAIEGRAAELFWVEADDGPRFLSGVLFHNAADSLHVIREWRAIQRTGNRVEVQVQFLPGETLAREEIERRLRDRLVEYGLPPSVELTVTVHGTIDSDAKTGKMRRMISELPAPAERRPAVVGC